ncbi:MAG: hypothetical protein A3K19_19860 [Lentisphaerae bacterium RIFOXYB12_FULL_65_16]|nr:MAG: hypothetical protein A3K18_18955 [Lentisphaerae bacterium RIFOXYA12_64_32]OGV85110.1 MAG: hypothetical protein A3K19_19860 [Lentisphaerae bacterium RIFOXYB12_FULL_65_16]
MNVIHKSRSVIALLLGSGICAATLFAADPATEKAMADMESKAAEVKTCQADVVSKMKMMNQDLVSRGTVSFKQPGKCTMEFETEMGAMKLKQIIVSDGKTMWTHQPMMNMVTKIDLQKAADAVPGAAAGNLSKPFQGLKRDTISLVGSETLDGVETQVFEATPDAQGAPNNPLPSDGKMKVWLGTADGMVRKVAMADPAGAEVMTQTYSNVKINGDIPDSKFEFTPPEGAQVMDMTEQALKMMKPDAAAAPGAPAAVPAAPAAPAPAK